MKKIINIFIVFITYSSCRFPVERAITLKVINNSNKRIAYITSLTYPDTSVPSNNDIIRYVQANSYANYEPTEDWSSISGNSNGKISFFFIDADTLNSYGLDTIRTQYKILERKDFTIKAWDSVGHTVSYP